MVENNVRISQRDLNLLFDIYENVFLAFYQIHERHFRHRAKPTVYNRLSKLMRGGFLQPLRVNLNAYHHGGFDIGVIYQITPKALSVIRNYTICDTFDKGILQLNRANLYHDLVLTDVILKLKNHFPTCKIKNAKLQKFDPKDASRLPDAILNCPHSNSKVAIELELTAKSENRYQEIIHQYRVHSDFSHVLYVVGKENLFLKMGGLITGFKNRFKATDETGKFYFIALGEVLKCSQPKFLSGMGGLKNIHPQKVNFKMEENLL
ncbi:MAG: replication-relaxation family protein [Bdellovibrionales bacterium]|nr:replication-relaxation family protein [Bdellovibrionales bacterium]